MKIIVDGASGRLGKKILQAAPAQMLTIGTDIRPSPNVGDDAVVDLCDRDQLHYLVAKQRPDAFFHGAAYVDVDGAQQHRVDAIKGNIIASTNVAEACRKHGVRLIHISTDYVFDGTKGLPYKEDDAPNPRSVYGQTKLYAEDIVRSLCPDALIVRTQWLYGVGDDKHFVGAILNRAKAGKDLRVVNDQFGSPTTTTVLARVIWKLFMAGQTGIFHAACTGRCSWHEFAVAILDLCHIKADVKAVTTEEYFADKPHAAPRPPDSTLDCSKLAAVLGGTPPHWRTALREFLTEYPH